MREHLPSWRTLGLVLAGVAGGAGGALILAYTGSPTLAAYGEQVGSGLVAAVLGAAAGAVAARRQERKS